MFERHRWAGAVLGGAMVLFLQAATAAPVAAGPVAAGPVAAGPLAAGPLAAGPAWAGKPPQPVYTAPAIAEPRQDNASALPRPLTAADKRPSRRTGGPSVNAVGGAPASAGEYPYFASIWRQGTPICGGSLMSNQMVLTAAHCVNSAEPISLYQVRIGGTQLSGPDSGVLREVAGQIPYPGWVRPTPFPTLPPVLTRFDVTILVLSSPITRADAAAQWLRPAEGNELGLVDPGDSATLIGHGSNSPPVNQLTELPVTIQSDQMSLSRIGSRFEPALMLGAGGTPAGGQGACRTDDGGPLVITSTPQHLQIGNLSWFATGAAPSFPCAPPNTPDVYSELYQGSLAAFVNSVVSRTPNDRFAGAVTLTGNSGSVTGNNTNATLEPGESGTEIETTIWYRWKPTESGTARITVNQHAFDSEVRVYTGSSVSALTLVATNNDANGSLQSQVEFPAVAGKIYQVQVDGFQFDYGSFRLSYAVNRPANDDFANATAITDTSACPVTASTVNATGQAGEPTTASGDGDATLWYSWTASAAGVARFTTAGSDFDTTLAAYTGTSLTGLTQVAVNDQFNGTNQSQITFVVPEAGTYLIRVGGFNGARGALRLQHALEPEPNDLFIQPQVLANTSGIMSGSNERGLTEPGEPAFLPTPTSTVWYRWTAPLNGRFRFTTEGSGFDTELAVLTGAAVTGLTLLASNDDDIGSQSRVEFQATANTTYWIWVDGFGCDKGTIQLNWRQI